MLEELWALNETNKKRLLVVVTIIVMAIIVGVWVSYFNSVIMGASSAPAAQTASAVPKQATTSTIAPAPPVVSHTAPAQQSSPGLWQYIESGASHIVNIFKDQSQYTIQPQ